MIFVLACHVILLSTLPPPPTTREFMLHDVKPKMALIDCNVLTLHITHDSQAAHRAGPLTKFL